MRFNPRPSCEGRPRNPVVIIYRERFQSAPLLRGATICEARQAHNYQFQSAPLLRGATPRDPDAAQRPASFNPRPSCEGRRNATDSSPLNAWFQSAPLLRGATVGSTDHKRSNCGFNPRPSCEGRPSPCETIERV